MKTPVSNNLRNNTTQVYTKWQKGGWYTPEENQQLRDTAASNAAYKSDAMSDGSLTSEERSSIFQNAKDARKLVGNLAWNGDY